MRAVCNGAALADPDATTVVWPSTVLEASS